MTTKPVCVPCLREMVREKSMVEFTALLGTEEQQPYQLWHADLWRCPACGHAVIMDYGDNAISHHHNDDYAFLRAGADLKRELYSVPERRPSNGDK